MDDIEDRAPGGDRPPAGASPASAARRTSCHVHATPAAVVAEMDLRRRQWVEWLALSRSRAGAGETGGRPEAGRPG